MKSYSALEEKKDQDLVLTITAEDNRLNARKQHRS